MTHSPPEAALLWSRSGNKAARRAGPASLVEVEKLMKEFRKESLTFQQ